MDITIKLAKIDDLPIILELQYSAFQKEAADYQDYDIEPLQQTIHEIEEEFEKVTF